MEPPDDTHHEDSYQEEDPLVLHLGSCTIAVAAAVAVIHVPTAQIGLVARAWKIVPAAVAPGQVAYCSESAHEMEKL